MYIGLIRASVLAANWDKWRAGPVCRWPVSWPDINLILTFPLSPPDQTFFTILLVLPFQECIPTMRTRMVGQQIMTDIPNNSLPFNL